MVYAFIMFSVSLKHVMIEHRQRLVLSLKQGDAIFPSRFWGFDERVTRSHKVKGRTDHVTIPNDLQKSLYTARTQWRQSPGAAYVYYDSLLLHFPDHPAILREYAKALFHENDDLEKSIALFEKALQRDPEAWLSWLYLAVLYGYGYGKGYLEALVVYKHIIDHFPDHIPACVEAYLRIGTSYEKPGITMSLQEAINAIRQAIKLDPASAEAYECLSWVLYDAKDWQEACEALSMAIQLYRKRGKSVDDLIERYQLFKRKEPWKYRSFPSRLTSFEWPDGEIE